MNAEVAHAAAWTQADRRVQQTNIALNEFDAAAHHADIENRLRLVGDFVITDRLLRARAAKRRIELSVAVARVAARLARIEAQS